MIFVEKMERVANLKPCPFCGGRAEYSQKKAMIFCVRCDARICGPKICAVTPAYGTFLAGLWNRRTNENESGDKPC